MKSILKNTTTLLMVLILLVPTMQFSLYKMECIKSGNISLSLTKFQSCDKTTPVKSSLSKKCCNFNNIAFDFDYDANIGFKTLKVNTHTILSFNRKTKPAYSSRAIKHNNYNNLPPPSGTELLQLVQVFRI